MITINDAANFMLAAGSCAALVYLAWLVVRCVYAFLNPRPGDWNHW